MAGVHMPPLIAESTSAVSESVTRLIVAVVMQAGDLADLDTGSKPPPIYVLIMTPKITST